MPPVHLPGPTVLPWFQAIFCFPAADPSPFMVGVSTMLSTFRHLWGRRTLRRTVTTEPVPRLGSR